MAQKKKFEIEGINKNQEFCEAGKIILSEKLKDIFSLINVLFKDDSSENIHALRIALRRFRYVFEIFSLCYNKKLFNYVYEKIKFTLNIFPYCINNTFGINSAFDINILDCVNIFLTFSNIL